MMKLRIRDTFRSLCHAKGVAWGVVSLWVILLTFSSCYNKTDLTDYEQTTKTVQVQFTIAVGNTTNGNAAKRNTTRAATGTDWTEYSPDTVGVGIENNIDVQNLHIVLYNTYTNGQIKEVAGVVQNLRITSPTDNSNGQVYNVFGDMTIPTDRLINEETFQGRVMVFANTEVTATNYWNTALLSSLSSLTYTYNKDISQGTPYTVSLKSIPMWGISPQKSITLRGGQYNDLGTINLLRAMAKVKVNLRPDMIEKGYSLKSVVLNRYNTSGNVMPSGVEQLASDEDTKNLTYEESFSIPSDVIPSNEGLSFLRKEGDYESQTLYIPEYDNTSTGVTPATITVTIQNGSTEITGTLQFRDYSTDGKPTGNMYNIVRNHYYTFNVFSKGGVNLKVVPWTSFDHEPFTW